MSRLKNHFSSMYSTCVLTEFHGALESNLSIIPPCAAKSTHFRYTCRTSAQAGKYGNRHMTTPRMFLWCLARRNPGALRLPGFPTSPPSDGASLSISVERTLCSLFLYHEVPAGSLTGMRNQDQPVSGRYSAANGMRGIGVTPPSSPYLPTNSRISSIRQPPLGDPEYTDRATSPHRARHAPPQRGVAVPAQMPGPHAHIPNVLALLVVAHVTILHCLQQIRICGVCALSSRHEPIGALDVIAILREHHNRPVKPASSSACSTGTESAVPPSRYRCPSISTGCVTSGKDVEARTASMSSVALRTGRYAAVPNITSVAHAYISMGFAK